MAYFFKFAKPAALNSIIATNVQSGCILFESTVY